MSYAADDYVWNIPVAEHCALTFCAFLESCCFDVPAGFRHDPSMRSVEHRDLGVLCAELSQVR